MRGNWWPAATCQGFTKDDVKVEVADNAINISGERKAEQEERGKGYYRSERSYGSFYRSIRLPVCVYDNAFDGKSIVI